MTRTAGSTRIDPNAAPLIDIDLDAIAANWRAFEALGPAAAGAAIKADGYGLGASVVAPALFAAGCRTFFAATLGEASEALEAIDAHHGRAPATVYALNGFRPDPRLDPRLGAVVSAAESLADWARAADQRPIALQLETGMNRLGVDLPPADLLAILADRAPALVMSHLACADDPSHALNATQAARFEALSAPLVAAWPSARRSLAATGGALLGERFAYDLIRPGVGLYGGLPFAAAKPVIRVSAPVLRVADIAVGETSGYGAAWTAARPSRIATIAAGYADGFPRQLENRGQARLDGETVPIIGRVSMDLIVLDVTDLEPRPRPGDRAFLIDDVLTIDRVAAAAGTIGYEILTGLGPQLGSRARRRYSGAVNRKEAD